MVYKFEMLLVWQALAEFIGSMLFLTVILAYPMSPIAVAVGLLAAIYAFGRCSGGHFNSTVSIMLYMKGDIRLSKLLIYILAQVAGAAVAFAWWHYTNTTFRKLETTTT